MLAQIRAFAKSPFAIGILGLLLVSFAVFGIGDVFRNQIRPDTVVQAGSRTVNAAAFKQQFDQARKSIEQRSNNGQPVTMEQLVAAGIDRAVLDQVVAQESFAEVVTRMGLVPSDKLVVAGIRETKAFFDPVSGRFDRATYQERLQSVGLTEQRFEGTIRDGIAQSHLVSGLAAGLTVPRSYVAGFAAYGRETRDFSWFEIGPQLLGRPTPPTDAQLAAFVKENAQQFTRPEQRLLSVVVFSAAAIAPKQAVAEADVKKRFDFEKETLSVPETRSFVQVPVKDAAAAAQAADRLRKGEDPNAVAKAMGSSAVAYVDAPKTAVSDRKIGDVAFGTLKAGEVSGLVQGTLGQAVIKVTKVAAGHQATLEEARPKIEGEIRKEAATDQVYKLVQKYDDARSGGANMAEAAKAAGMTVTTAPAAITAQGKTLDGRQMSVPPKLMQAAFMLPQSGESDVIDLGQGEYAAVRVDKVLASGLAGLDEVRPAATQFYVMRDLQKGLKAKAEALAARLRKGEPVAQVAASVGAKVQTAAGLGRQADPKVYSQDLVGQVFQAKPGAVIIAEDVKLGMVLARLDRIDAASSAALAPLVEQQRDNFRNGLFNDMGTAAQNAARLEARPKVDYAQARKAIGLEPETAPAPAKTAAKK